MWSVIKAQWFNFSLTGKMLMIGFLKRIACLCEVCQVAFWNVTLRIGGNCGKEHTCKCRRGKSCCCSVPQLCPTLFNPMDCSTPGFPVLHSLQDFVHVHWVDDTNCLIFCHPLLLLYSIFPSIRVFSNELALHIRWPNYWGFRFSINPFSEYSGLISFRIDWFVSPCCPRDSQEYFPAQQFESISSLVLTVLYGPTLTSVHEY